MFFDTRPKVQVHIAQTNESFPCAGDESLLKGMLRLGRKGIPVGCVNGGCGVCKVKMISGEVKMAVEDALDPDDKANGIILACQAMPIGDIAVEA